MNNDSDGDLSPFIPAQLDDYGLTMAQYRVLCRVARRGECFEAVERIAKGCRMEVKTCKKAIKFLVAAGLLAKEPAPGKCTIYRIVPLRLWPESKPDQSAPHPNGTGGAKRSATPSKRLPTTRSKRLIPKPDQSAPPEGYPSEGNPMKAIPEGSGMPATGARSERQGGESLLPDVATLEDWLDAAEEIGYAHIYGGELEAVHAWNGLEGVGWVIDARGTPVTNWRGLVRSRMETSQGKLPAEKHRAKAFEVRKKFLAWEQYAEINIKAGASGSKNMIARAKTEMDALKVAWSEIVESAK